MNAYANAQLAYDFSEPIEIVEAPELTDEQHQDQLAEQWVKDGGDVDLFLAHAGDIAARIITWDGVGEDSPAEYMAQRCVDRGLSAGWFRASVGEIRSWIVCHMSAYGRF